MTMTNQPAALDQYLTVEQRQRALAAHEAKTILRSSAGAFVTRPVDLIDIVTLAQWIIDGEDPWDEDPLAANDADPLGAEPVGMAP